MVIFNRTVHMRVCQVQKTVKQGRISNYSFTRPDKMAPPRLMPLLNQMTGEKGVKQILFSWYQGLSLLQELFLAQRTEREVLWKETQVEPGLKGHPIEFMIIFSSSRILDHIGPYWTIVKSRLFGLVSFNPSILTCLFGPSYFDPYIWTRIFGPVYLDLSIWTHLLGIRLFRPDYLDRSILTRLFVPVSLHLSIWNRLFGPVYLDLSIKTHSFGSVFLDLFIKTHLLGFIFFGPSIWICLLVPVYLDPLICFRLFGPNYLTPYLDTSR